MRKISVLICLLLFISLVPVKSFGQDKTIAEIFPDSSMASAVAGKLAGGDINHVLTQSEIDNVTSLTLTYKNIRDITGIDIFRNLETLMVYDNDITFLPDNINALTKLKTFHVYNNEITYLPESIGDLKSLEVLHLSNNFLTELPSRFGELTNLKTLYLVNNQLEVLPESFGNLSNLEVARLTQNNLIKLPTDISNMTHIKELRLFQNQIAYLPDSISSLTTLTLIDMGENQLTSLPEGIGNLTNLTTLYLDHNLLPTDYDTKLNTLGLNFTVQREVQRQLILDTTDLFHEIKNKTDIDNINLSSKVVLSNLAFIQGYVERDYTEIVPKASTEVSKGHTLLLDNFRDENDQSVSIEDYIKDDVVIKDGQVFPQIRAQGLGLFPNNSSNAITVDTLTLNFTTTLFELSFDLNGGEGEPPSTQLLLEKEITKAVDNPTKEGYTFKGWNSSKDGLGNFWTLGQSTMKNYDLTLYAIWEKDNDDNNNDDNDNDNNNGSNNGNPGKVSPKTDDEANILLYMILTLASLGYMLGMRYMSKRKYNK